MAAMAVNLVSTIGEESIIILDAYFSVGSVFSMLEQAVDEQGKRLLHVITRAKSNVVAFMDPPEKSGKPGRPCVYGLKVKLKEQFEAMDSCFQKTTIEIYNQSKELSFLCLDLFWKPASSKVRFVLMSSDLSLSALDIIRCYSYRFKIELNFKVLKHVIGVFSDFSRHI